MAIGGAEDREGDCGLLRVFAGLCGAGRARIALITTASAARGDVFAAYSAAFRRLGAGSVRELPIVGREDADGEQARTGLAWATGVFLTGGDQARLGPLVGSRVNERMRARLAGGTLAVAGTSAGATALGAVMILGDGVPADGPPRTGPGLGLLPGAVIDMHFSQRRRLPRLVAAAGQYGQLTGIGIDEDTAVVAGAGRLRVLGRGAVVTVEPGRPADPLRRLRAGDDFALAGQARDHIEKTEEADADC